MGPCDVPSAKPRRVCEHRWPRRCAKPTTVKQLWGGEECFERKSDDEKDEERKEEKDKEKQEEEEEEKEDKEFEKKEKVVVVG